MNRLTGLIREPLLHFLAAGVALFLVFEFVGDRDSELDPRTISVDREALLTFMQFRLRSFDNNAASARLDNASESERAAFVEDFIREEALYREALGLGLDKDDYIIRRRLVQKVEFLAQGFAEVIVSPDEAALRDYYEANRDSYFVAPWATFTHVFFSDEKRRRAETIALAMAELTRLNREAVPFAAAPSLGERFLYNTNYVEKGRDFVASHFGTEFADALLSLSPSSTEWQGPLRSRFGAHLVMLVRSEPGRHPTLDEVRARVADDFKRVRIREMTDATIERIVASYDVRLTYQAQEGSTPQ